MFDKTKTALGLAPKAYSFTDRLLAAGTNNNSYNRYTFYRLLSQLGTDSAPEPGGKMNLNYCNVDTNGYVVPNMATNFIPWTPVQFFTNAAIRLLADAGYSVGAPYSTSNLLVLRSNYVNGFWIASTNLQIPLWPTNFYTPSVHRALPARRQHLRRHYQPARHALSLSTVGISSGVRQCRGRQVRRSSVYHRLRGGHQRQRPQPKQWWIWPMPPLGRL